MALARARGAWTTSSGASSCSQGRARRDAALSTCSTSSDPDLSPTDRDSAPAPHRGLERSGRASCRSMEDSSRNRMRRPRHACSRSATTISPLVRGLRGDLRARTGKRRPGTLLQLRFRGSAGQSFGAFTLPRMHLQLEGEAATRPRRRRDCAAVRSSSGPSEEPRTPTALTLLGNTALYGATSGRLVRGRQRPAIGFAAELRRRSPSSKAPAITAASTADRRRRGGARDPYRQELRSRHVERHRVTSCDERGALEVPLQPRHGRGQRSQYPMDERALQADATALPQDRQRARAA